MMRAAAGKFAAAVVTAVLLQCSRMTRSLLAALCALALVALPQRADAQRAQQPAGPPPPPPSAHPPVRWDDDWPRFSVAEAMISAAVTLRNGDLGTILDGPREAVIKFQVPILDHGARDLLRAASPGRRKGAGRLSDIGFRSLVLAPYVLDVGVGALAIQRNPDVAAQLALIDFEVLTLAGMTQLLGSRVIGRARPYVDECPPEGCGGGPYRSFLSGHTMASFTAAGLICVHHKFLPLFGGGAADVAPCAWAVTVASLTGVLRLVADEHWASDVLVGAGMGWLYGYYLPQLLHFHARKVVTSRRNGAAFEWMPTVTGTADSATAGVLGSF